MTIASVHELTKTYGMPGSDARVEALRSVSIDFKEAESVAVCGQSGSGKSTLMNLLGCLDRPTAGRYLLGGVDVATLDDDALADIRGRYIGFVFQSFNLIAQLTLLENLEVPLFYQGCPQHTRHRTARKLIDKVDLADRAHHRPSELSGGQQQRAAIARALINDPLLILADEPTGNLDTATGEMILGIFNELRREGRTIIMVTHEQPIAHQCDRVITLRDGAVVNDTRTRTRDAHA
ncbi:MAG: ABC transporter ATP-binding protein [Planctomycetota bacterium]|jgi:putative ABC transport system ATP-binding protein